MLATSGYFCVNVLAEGQQETARRFGVFGPDKFAGLSWSRSRSGAPVLSGVLTWVECAVEAVHKAGDHYLVVGRVTELGPPRPGRPLLFYPELIHGQKLHHRSVERAGATLTR